MTRSPQSSRSTCRYLVRRRSTWAIVLGIGALAHLLAQAGPSGRMGGQVVDTATGTPIAGAQIDVGVASAPAGEVRRSAVTDAAGRYEIPSIGAGSYVVTASKPSYVNATFGRLHTMDTGGTIEITPGQDRLRVDFQLSREAALLGRVVGATGAGLENLLISASRPHLDKGQRQLVSFGSARSDQRGEYRIAGLPPGDYYVSVSLFERSDSRAAQYAPTFYPGTAEAATALRVHLSPGATVRIDPVTPLPVPWTRLTGKLEASDGKQLMRGAMIIQPRDPEGLSLSPDSVLQMFPDGRFSFDFVVPGHYVVRAQGNTGVDHADLFAAWPVDVDGTAIAEQTMTLRPGSELSGDARFEGHGTVSAIDSAAVRVHAPLANASRFAAESETRLHADNTFRLESVDAGLRMIRVDGLPFPWSLESIKRGAIDISDEPLDIRQGQKLQDVTLAFTDIVTGVSGRVVNRAGEPAANYLVVIFPIARTQWRLLSRYIASARADWEGHYRLSSLPPGEYRLAAGNDFDDEDAYDRETLTQLTPRSIPVTLVAGELRPQTVVVTFGQRSDGG